MRTYYRCGECSRRFDDEEGIRAHVATPDAAGDLHDGSPWTVVDDQIAIVARRAVVDDEHGAALVPWVFHGRWRFGSALDFPADESIGNTIRTLARDGYVDIRVLHLDAAERLYRSTLDKEGR